MEIKQLVQNKLTNLLNRIEVNNQQLTSDFRVDIVIKLINQSNWPVDKQVDIITAIALLQMSVDIHQQVANQHCISNAWQILNGDYLSSQYYVLVAKYDEPCLIHSLALAIKEINQLKVQVIHQQHPNDKLYLKKKVEIELKLLFHLIHYFDLHMLEAFIKEVGYYYLLEAEQKSLHMNLKQVNDHEIPNLDILQMESQLLLTQINKQIPLHLQNLATFIDICLKEHFTNKAKLQS